MQKNYYVFETDSRNKYCYNIILGSLLLCHPLLYYMISLHRHGRSVSSWYRELSSSTTCIPDGSVWDKSEVDYYFRKFCALLSSNFFSERNEESSGGGLLSQNDVEAALKTTGTVTFELTEACNLNCLYCCYGKHYVVEGNRSGRYMNEDLAFTLLDYLFAIWNSAGNELPRKISLGFYGGEPLLGFPLLQRIVERAIKLNGNRRELEFRMTSNGLLIAQHADFLAKHDVDLLVSLDGDEQSNSYRVLKNGSPSFERVLENVVALQVKHPSYFERRVRFHAVFNSRSSMNRIYDFFKMNFNRTVSVSPLSTVNLNSTHEESFYDICGDPIASLERSVKRLQIEQDMFPRLAPASYVTKFLCNNCFVQCRDLNVMAFGKFYNSRLPTGTCIPFSKRVFLSVDGAILPCERVGRAITLGNVSPSGVSIDYEGIARQYNKYYDKLMHVCRECHGRSSCSVCMLELDFSQSDIRCPGFLSDDGFSKYLAHIFQYLEENRWVIPRAYREAELI